MPTIWVPPEIYLEHKEFVVYHVYKNDDMDNGLQRECWFTLQAIGSDSDGHGENGTFDYRKLPEAVPEDYLPDEWEDVRAIKYHIDHGYFNDWEHDKPTTLRRASTPEAKAACLDRIIVIWKTTKSNSQVAQKIEAELQVYLGTDWTDADSTAASTEGWDIFNADHRGTEIERIDAPEDDSEPRFVDDEAAVAHVTAKAQSGSELHCKALATHQANLPAT